mgnify:CR=1 FL=1
MPDTTTSISPIGNLGEAVLHRIFLQSSEAILVTDRDNCIIAVNAAFSELSSYTADEVLGRNPRMFASGRNEPAFYAAMWQAINNEGVWSGEIWNRRKNGNLYPIWLTISAVHDDTGEVSNYVATFTDIGERIEATQKLLHLAYHDPLTLLPNRLAFESQLELAIRSCERDQKQVALEAAG